MIYLPITSILYFKEQDTRISETKDDISSWNIYLWKMLLVFTFVEGPAEKKSQWSTSNIRFCASENVEISKLRNFRRTTWVLSVLMKIELVCILSHFVIIFSDLRNQKLWNLRILIRISRNQQNLRNPNRSLQNLVRIFGIPLESLEVRQNVQNPEKNRIKTFFWIFSQSFCNLREILGIFKITSKSSESYKNFRNLRNLVEIFEIFMKSSESSELVVIIRIPWEYLESF